MRVADQGMDGTVVTRMCQAGNQNDVVLYQASQGPCVNSRGAIHPFIKSGNHKNDFETMILGTKNSIVLL